MKEIKFRVWDIEYKRFVNGFYIEENGDIRNFCYSDIGEPHTLQNHRLQIIFFTGMKDKNEIDIYEGDILRFEIGNHNSWNTFQNEVVEWRGLTLHPFELKHRASVEVIGNIYENLELIK
jgi:hypothetical protein